MPGLKVEGIDYPCKKLGAKAHAEVKYYYSNGHGLLADFKCNRAADCGISRSPFSSNFNFTVHCPLYIALDDNL